MTGYNRSQRLGLDIDRHVAIDAGAGTGKTTVMSERYIQHLLSPIQRATSLLPNGPRRPLKGAGSIIAPKREQISLDEWKGLLPSECVAITFTNKAAEELRQKIRKGLNALLSTDSFNEGPVQDRTDPRISTDGELEHLISLLNDAPIGTIDSFFASLVSNWKGILSDIPTNEYVSEERRPHLVNTAIQSAWRMQSTDDGFALGLIGDISSFINSRNRLSWQMGGQLSAQKIIESLLDKSLFVEEAERSLRTNYSSGARKISLESIKSLFLSMIPNLNELANELFELYSAWIDVCREHWQDFDLANALASESRFASINELIESGCPDNSWEKLLWCHHLLIASCPLGKILDPIPSVFPESGLLPFRGKNTWKRGMGAYGNLNASIREPVKQKLSKIAEEIRERFSNPEMRMLRTISRSAYLFSPDLPVPKLPKDCSVFIEELECPIPILEPSEKTQLSAIQQLELIEDLFIVHSGVQSILRDIKSRESVHDHSDIQRLAEDLLLSHCPEICRQWYPTKVIEALDKLETEAWRDTHIENALNRASENSDVFEDLTRRFEILKKIRRQYLTFIIDEYQDTNPQQFRLLARLWGPRSRLDGDPSPPESEWDPTICLVGDVKQSIYRFRQAQVTVMKRTAESIRKMNTIEFANESRLSVIRRDEYGRDPRPLSGGIEGGSFITGNQKEIEPESMDESWIAFDLDDAGLVIDFEKAKLRSKGHIDLSTNYRTAGGLLHLMNDWFEDSFSEKHDILNGDWHARQQKLNPSPENRDKPGNIEWLLPINQGNEVAPIDLEVPLDPFEIKSTPNWKLENEMIASRLHSLINGYPTKIMSTETEMVEIPPQSIVNPEDITILLPRRTHISDLMDRLARWGVPAQSDRQSNLLKRPIVSELVVLLNAIAKPSDRHAIACLARSSFVSMNDSELQSFLMDKDGKAVTGNLIVKLIDFAANKKQKNMFNIWSKASFSGEIIPLFELMLNQSDILIAHSDNQSRQEAEHFIKLIHSISNSVGGDLALLSRRINSMIQQGVKIESETSPSSNAVNVMTIHSAKGLENKVIVVAGLFDDGQQTLTLSQRGNLLITPELIAGRMRPWQGGKTPEMGIWDLVKTLTKAQIAAEARRLFYVALTRTKNHLILSGSPKRMSVNYETGVITITRKPSDLPSMGEMWLESLRQTSLKYSYEESPWTFDGDEAGSNLTPIIEEKGISFSPSKIIERSFLGPKAPTDFRIYHSPKCFGKSENLESPFSLTRKRVEALNKKSLNLEEETVYLRGINLEIAPSKLDVSSQCKRRYVLENYTGLSSNPIKLIKTINQPSESKISMLPLPAELGTMYHRLMEIGIGNPTNSDELTSDLPDNWLRSQKSLASDHKTINRVIEELLPIGRNSEKTAKRLNQLSKLMEEGPLGLLCKGDEIEGMKVEGLITEMPFNVSFQQEHSELYCSTWTPFGDVKSHETKRSTVGLNGRIDLVLALRDSEGNGYLRAIDFKTEECTKGFNFENPSQGNPLQILPNNPDNFYERTDAESELLDNHKMQLALYNKALKTWQEALQEESQTREVLAPAIMVAASGRLISWNEDEMLQNSLELDELLNWTAKVSALPEFPLNDFSRLDISKKNNCKKCPFFVGDIRICAPIGEQFGINKSEE